MAASFPVRLALTPLLVLLLAMAPPRAAPGPVALAQDAGPPCRVAELEAAAFLIGEWTVTERERASSEPGGWRERTGTSVWERRVGGCAFVEWISHGVAYREMRVLAYDGRAGEWTLAIVDSNHGNLVTMVGRQVPDGLEFTSAQTRRGRLLLDRLVYRAASAERLDVRTETSSDAGESWTTIVETRYARAGTAKRQVALTFDDLPMTGDRCDAARVRDVTAKLTGILQTRALPAAGLVTPGGACTTSALLEETLGRWQAVGAVLGNHSATHPDLNSTSAEAYVANIERAQRLIDDAVRTEGRWFRAPYLHTGNEPKKKEALRAYLAANGYRVAPVTVDNQEWVYAAVYADARGRADENVTRRVADAYIDHLTDSMAFYERLSMHVFGREIPQILLLHANLLNAEQLGRVVDMLEGRGYAFIGLPNAVADPAYAREDTYVGPRGLSWLQRWALEDGVPIPPEPREAPWVAEAFRAIRDEQFDGVGAVALPSAHPRPALQLPRVLEIPEFLRRLLAPAKEQDAASRERQPRPAG